jgi:hypothetical protein
MKIFKLALASCVLILSACTTVDNFVEDIRYADWLPASGKNASKSENLLSDGCPQAQIVPELGVYGNFIDDRKPTGSTLVSRAEISTIESKCQYASQSVTVDIKLAFNGRLGPAARMLGSDATVSYPYFVAVTSPTGAILAKEVFAASMNFSGQTDQTYTETMRQIIPIPNRDAGEHFKVLAGFQLSDDQLRYNRAVIAADEAARREREKLRKAQAEAAKKGAKRADKPDVVIVPDTMTPSDSSAQPVEIRPLN